MITIKEHLPVWNKKSVGNIPTYTKGTIVHIYPSNHSIVEVEFSDENGNTLSVETVETLNLVERKKFLVALPAFPNDKGFNHRTVLVYAIDENDARIAARRLKPHDNIGEIKEVNY